MIGAWGLGDNVIAPQLRALDRADSDVLHIFGRFTLLDQSALQFGGAHPAIATVIPGTKHPQRAKQNARLFDAKIPSQLWADLKSEQIVRAEAPIDS